MVYIRNIGGDGERVPITEDDTKIIFGIEENNFTVDVAELQTDTQITFDVMQDNDGKLCTEGNWYAATITIPPKRYGMVEDTKNPAKDDEEPTLIPVALPLDMGAVEVILYPLGKSLVTQSEEMGISEEAE